MSPTAGPGQIIANIALVSCVTCVRVCVCPRGLTNPARHAGRIIHVHTRIHCLHPVYYFIPKPPLSVDTQHADWIRNFYFDIFFFVSPFSFVFHHSNIMDANMRKYSSHATRQRARVRNRRAQALRLLNQLTQPDVSNERWNDIIWRVNWHTFHHFIFSLPRLSNDFVKSK